MTRKPNKISTTLLALLIITALILTPGCTKKEEEIIPEDILPVVNDITFTTYNQFALDLLKNTRQENQNIILSPISIGITMTMLRLGAAGDTAKQIDEVLGMTIDDYSIVEEQCAQIVSRLNDLSGVWYENGVGLYIDEGPSIKESYAVMAEDKFAMDVEFINFDNPRAEIDMNDWADIKTSGRLEKLVKIDELPHDLLTLLVNLSALDCKWEMSFDSTNNRPLPFNMYDGKGVAVPMMRGKLAMNYYKDDDATVAFIPMDGKETSLAIIMPPEGDILSEFIEGMTAEDIELWRYISVEAEHFVNIPKIDWQQIISFKPILANMGASDIFDVELADFSDLGNGFYLGDMWQTTIFRAVEGGAKDSNITAIDLTRAQGQGEYFFSVNRPFLFAVIDEKTGGILMIGTMTNPLEDNTYTVDEN